MKKLGFGLVLLLLAACGKEALQGGGRPSGPYGKWLLFNKTIHSASRNAHVVLRAYTTIESNRVIQEVECDYSRGTQLRARAESPAMITANTIEVLKSSEDVVQKDGMKCSASINAVKINFTVEGDKMHWSQAGSSDSHTLSRP